MQYIIKLAAVWGVVLGLSTSAVAKSYGPQQSTTSSVDMHVLAGMPTISGDFAGNFMVGATFQVDPTFPLKIGIESGLFYASGVAIPIFVTGYVYMGRPSKTQTYLGFSVGTTIGVDDSGNAAAIDGGPAGDSVRLAFLFRPGVKVQLLNQLSFQAEMLMGGLTGLFIIGPQAGISIAF